MTGIFNRKPPTPKYTFIWDVEQILIYLKSLPSVDNLSDRTLLLKLTTLLFLTSAGRCHEICYLDVRYMVKSCNSYKCYFAKVTKSWKKGRAPPCLELFEYPEDSALCVVTCIDEYLKRSTPWRDNGQTQLLLSHLRPHKEVKRSTIANWVKLVMSLSGIDVSVYKAHSCRSASTSKAKVLGLSLEDILKRGQWTNISTWQRFYNKQIIRAQSSFSSTILGNNALN